MPGDPWPRDGPIKPMTHDLMLMTLPMTGISIQHQIETSLLLAPPDLEPDGFPIPVVQPKPASKGDLEGIDNESIEHTIMHLAGIQEQQGIEAGPFAFLGAQRKTVLGRAQDHISVPIPSPAVAPNRLPAAQFIELIERDLPVGDRADHPGTCPQRQNALIEKMIISRDINTQPPESEPILLQSTGQPGIERKLTS